jgi:hypothetical protein
LSPSVSIELGVGEGDLVVEELQASAGELDDAGDRKAVLLLERDVHRVTLWMSTRSAVPVSARVVRRALRRRGLDWSRSP